jgi:hypothetical protein
MRRAMMPLPGEMWKSLVQRLATQIAAQRPLKMRGRTQER